jgi:hypothetical protein
VEAMLDHWRYDVARSLRCLRRHQIMQSSEQVVAATLANGIMIAKGGTPTPIEAVALYFECLDALKSEHRSRYAPTA